MSKYLSIFLSLSCISLSAYFGKASTFSIKTIQQQTNANNDFNISNVKQKYSDHLQYAVYTAVSSYLAHLFCSRHLPPETKSLFLTITLLSNIWGASNMAKWLFLQLNPNSKREEVEFLERSEALIAVILGLYLKEGDNLKQLICDIRIPQQQLQVLTL